MFSVLPSGLATLSRSGPASVGSWAADEYVLPGMSSQWSGATLRMAVTAAWTVSAQVEVVRSWGSFMMPKMTLGSLAYLVAREVQRAAKSVLLCVGQQFCVGGEALVSCLYQRGVSVVGETGHTVVGWAALADDLAVPTGVVVDVDHALQREVHISRMHFVYLHADGPRYALTFTPRSRQSCIKASYFPKLVASRSPPTTLFVRYCQPTGRRKRFMPSSFLKCCI